MEMLPCVIQSTLAILKPTWKPKVFLPMTFDKKALDAYSELLKEREFEDDEVLEKFKELKEQLLDWLSFCSKEQLIDLAGAFPNYASYFEEASKSHFGHCFIRRPECDLTEDGGVYIPVQVMSDSTPDWGKEAPPGYEAEFPECISLEHLVGKEDGDRIVFTSHGQTIRLLADHVHEEQAPFFDMVASALDNPLQERTLSLRLTLAAARHYSPISFGPFFPTLADKV